MAIRASGALQAVTTIGLIGNPIESLRGRSIGSTRNSRVAPSRTL
jgi:hypothetical protein